MSKQYKRSLVCIGLLLIILLSLSIYYLSTKEDEREKLEVNVVDEISSYGYSLNSLDSDYYKELFEELKVILNEEEIDKEAYAKSVAKLFVTDLFSIDTKLNKYDIGGDLYYHENKRDLHKTKLSQTLYGLVEDNTYGDRDQVLPLVTSIEVINYDTSTFMLGKTEVNSYVITLKWTYEKDLGYDTEGVVTLVDNGNKIEVVEYKKAVQE